MSSKLLKKLFLPLSTVILLLTSGLMLITPACEKAKAAPADSIHSVFKYREIYLPEGTGKNAGKLGLNTLDDDWGIWGHNLSQVLPKEPSQNVFAKINGNPQKKQFCFSSNTLYGYIEEYIINNFGEEETVRFAIIPNDNEIVCLCEKCVTVGNTRKDASPAVTKLVRRLAERFPNHIFYTSDYKTTQKLPADTMPSNTGVLVSAINFPLSYEESPEEMQFIQRLQAWSRTTPRILVWDYINNFDDYFTPFPTFGAMQRRLRDYRDNKVTAVFLNGSGTDISALSKLRTEVLAELTADPDINWKEFLYERAKEDYPVTGKLIADYMISQEENLESSGNSLPLYEGVAIARETYLEEMNFINFHDSLLNMRDNLSGQEKEEVDILLGELALTRLEINRLNGQFEDSERFLTDLENLSSKGHPSYNESGWTIEGYVKDYRNILNHNREMSGRNKLKGEKLVALTALDPDYTDISILTDGALGIPSNYHNGNMIMSPDEFTRIAVPRKPGLNKIRVWLSYNPAYKITLPERVTLSIANKELQTEYPSYPNDHSGHSSLEFNVPEAEDGTVILTFYKGEDTRSFSIEEIEGW